MPTTGCCFTADMSAPHESHIVRSAAYRPYALNSSRAQSWSKVLFLAGMVLTEALTHIPEGLTMETLLGTKDIEDLGG